MGQAYNQPKYTYEEFIRKFLPDDDKSLWADTPFEAGRKITERALSNMQQALQTMTKKKKRRKSNVND